MPVQLPNGRNYFATATGAPMVGARLYTYVPGTSTPKDTYTTSVGNVANTNPVVADSRGEMVIYWDGTYDVVLRDSSDAVIWGPERLEDSGDTLRSDLADTGSASNGDALLGVKSTATDSVATNQHEVNERTRSVADFMSEAQRADCLSGAATLDCSAAVSTAVQWCIDNGVKILENPYKKVRLTASVIIDRQVDGAAFDSYFTIRGGGFYVTSAVSMFSSSIAFTTAAVSQLVRFENVTFEASGTGYDAYVLDDARFLRIWFVGCDFVKIKCIYAPTVLTQSYYFIRCNMRRWTGIFYRSLNVNFDTKFHFCIAEAGDRFARMAFPVGCSFHQNVIEGMSGAAIRAWGSQGLSVSGNYFEQNDIDCDYSQEATEATYGVAHTGNYHSHTPGGGYAPSSNYAVHWEECYHCNAQGNYGSTRIHSLIGANAQVRIDDYAVTEIVDKSGYYRPPYNAPAFSARADIDQSITTSVFTKVVFGTEEFDTNANFATSTFTPTVAGYYEFDAVIKVAGTNITRMAVGLYKNGSELQRLYDVPLASVSNWMTGVAGSVSMNGTTDYIEIWVYVVATTPSVNYDAATDTSRFSARYLRNNS